MRTALFLVCLALTTPAGAQAPKAAPIKLAIHSPLGAAKAEKDAKTLAPALSRLMGRQVTVQAADSEAIVALLAEGKVDAAWLSPLSFVRAKEKAEGVKAVAKALRHGAFFYRSVIFTRKEDAPENLKALQGKKVAWVSKSSTSGYLFPRAVLARQGMEPDTFFGAQSFAGDHPSVCKAVLEGAADVGATFADEPVESSSDPSLSVDGCKQVADPAKFAVVAKSGPISNDVIAVRAGIDPALADEIAGTFRELIGDDDGSRLLKEIFDAEAFGRASETDFESVRWAIKYIDKNAKK